MAFFPCEETTYENALNCTDIERIYEHIMDDESKMIFINRLGYSLTGDYGFINTIVRSTVAIEELSNKIMNQPVYLYGAGAWGGKIMDIFHDKRWKGVLDTYKTGTINRYQIQRVSEICIEPHDLVLVSLRNGYEEVKQELVAQGFLEKNIICLSNYYKLMNDRIYFDERCLEERKRCTGLFLDVGCYDAKDSIRARSYFQKQKLEIIAFEPDPKNIKKCESVLKELDNSVLVNKGVSDCEEICSFNMDDVGSRVSEKGDIKIETVALDHYIKKEKVGYIKMDIEGFEERALVGAEKLIKRDKPLLAISIYHKRDDIWRLPKLILDISPRYRFYFGHYTLSWSDTVLYAVSEEED